MWKKDVSHWFIICLSALVVAFCVYVIYLGAHTGDTSRIWAFAAFGVLFSIPLFVSLFHIVTERSIRFHKIYGEPEEAGKPHKTPFVPHWIVVSAIFVMGFSILFAVIKAVLSSLSK